MADREAVLAFARDLSSRSLGPGTAKYRELGKEVTLQYLSEDCLDLIDRADRILDVKVEGSDAQVAV